TVVAEGNSGQNGVVYCWDAVTGRERWRLGQPRLFPCSEAPVKSPTLSPDGKTVVTAGWVDEDKIRLWETATGRERAALGDKSLRIQRVASSPDSRILAANYYDHDGTIRVWDMVTGKELHSFTGHATSVAALAFSGDGRTLASAGHDATVLLWRVA